MRPTHPPKTMPPAVVLHQMMTGFWTSLAIYTAAELGVADHLKKGSRTIKELARAVRAQPDALYRLMRALASLGVFNEVKPGRFTTTPIGTCLQSNTPGSLRALVRTVGELDWEPWGNLLYSIKTGKTAFEKVHGIRFFDYLQKNPKKGRLFDEAMTGFVSKNISAVMDAYDFSSFSKVIDIGGGRGTFLSAVLKSNPSASGTLFDMPSVVKSASKQISPKILQRCSLVGGSFFDSVPSGADLYLMASIIHDWSDKQSVAILKNCRRAMPKHAKLLLIEMVIPPGNTPSFGKLLDLHMLVSLGGKERTAQEYGGLMSAAGLRLTQIVPTAAPVSIIEATRT